MSLSTTSSPETYDPLARPAMEAAMAWHGWGSPVGLAILLVAPAWRRAAASRRSDRAIRGARDHEHDPSAAWRAPQRSCGATFDA